MIYDSCGEKKRNFVRSPYQKSLNGKQGSKLIFKSTTVD